MRDSDSTPRTAARHTLAVLLVADMDIKQNCALTMFNDWEWISIPEIIPVQVKSGWC